MKQFIAYTLTVTALLILVVPKTVFGEVVPLAPLPTNFGDDTDTLPGYINTVFQMVIAVGAILAVLRIVWGGFQYMTSEAVTATKDARSIITMAILGLILLLGSWLILYVINPNLVKLKSLTFEPLEDPDNFSESAGEDAQQIRDEIARRNQKPAFVTTSTIDPAESQIRNIERRAERACPEGYRIEQESSKETFLGTSYIKYTVWCDI